MVVELSGLPVLRVDGELDGPAAVELRHAMSVASEAHGIHLVVDLSNTSYIESAAIGALIEIQVSYLERGGRLAVTCAPGNIARILEVSGLADVVPLFDSVESAVAFLSKR